MNLKCSTSSLLEALAVATRAITSKASIPVLECVLLRADKKLKQIFVTGNSLDIAITSSCSAEIEESGAMCISGRRFQNIVAALSGETVSIVALKHAVTMKCGPSSYRFMTIPSEEFPATPEIDDGQLMTFPQEKLSAAISSVAPAQSDDISRFVLNGTFLQRDATGSLYFVATDGRRMHTNSQPGEAESTPAGMILPLGAVQRIASLLADEGEVEVCFNDRFARFTLKGARNIVLTTKLVEGNFPAWQAVIKQIAGQTVKVDREEMIAAVHRAMLALGESNLAVRLTVSGVTLEIKADSSDFGDAVEIVACENKEGAAASVWLNGKFLMDAVSAVSGEHAFFHLRSGEAGPAAAVGITDGVAVRAIIMPVKR